MKDNILVFIQLLNYLNFLIFIHIILYLSQNIFLNNKSILLLNFKQLLLFPINSRERMRRKNIKIREFSLNGARINSACIAKISKQFFITGDSLNNIKLYTFNSDEQVNCLNSAANSSSVQSQVSAVQFNVLEDQIYAGSNRGIIHIWDIKQSKSISLLKGHSTSVNCFGIFPGEPNRMASGSYDTNIKLWDIRQKNNYATLKGHSKQVNSIDISPDRNMLVSGSQDNTAKIWDLRYPQKIITTYNQHTAPILRVLFNPDDMMFASCSSDKTAKYYRCQPPTHFSFVSSTDMVATPITAIAFDDYGKTLYTAANDTLKIWNMAKGGLLIETVQSPWKGVQDICWTTNGILGVAAGTHYLSIWAFDQKQKLTKKVSEKKQSDSNVFPNINKKKQIQKDVLEAMNYVNQAMGIVQGIQKQKKQKQQQKQITEQEKLAILEEQKRKAQQLQQQKLQRKRKKQQQQRKQKQQKLRKQLLRMQQQKKLLQQLEKQRIQRQRRLQQKIHQTFQEQVPQQAIQSSMAMDSLQSSTVLALSSFMVDGAQKQKLKQIQIIGQIMKDTAKFQTVIKHRINSLKPIIHFWKQGKIQSALSILSQTDSSIVSDCTVAILKSSKFKYAITPEVGVKLLIILTELMRNKHATYVKSSMSSINQIVNMFKDQLIKIKTFNPMTKNDPARQERLAKYDRLIEEFLNVFKQERLKKYASGKTRQQNTELIEAASELYNNLQDVLKKLVPKKQPEPA